MGNKIVLTFKLKNYSNENLFFVKTLQHEMLFKILLKRRTKLLSALYHVQILRYLCHAMRHSLIELVKLHYTLLMNAHAMLFTYFLFATQYKFVEIINCMEIITNSKLSCPTW